MFENIGNFFKKMMKSEQKELLVDTNPTSKDAAKERLHIVLMQDRANVSADFLELMKQEIIDVIKKYIVIDEDQIDVRLTNQESEDGTTGAPSLYANIPILNIRNDIKGEILSQNAKANTVNNFVKPAESNTSEEAIPQSNSSIEENKVEEKIDLNDRTVMIPIIDDETLKNSQKEQEPEEEVSSESLEESKEEVKEKNNENLEEFEEKNEEVENATESVEEKAETESSEAIENEEKENAESEPEELNIDNITKELDSADFEEDEEDDDDVTFDDLLKAAEEEEKKQAEEKAKEEKTTQKKSSKKPTKSSKKKNSKAKSKKK